MNAFYQQKKREHECKGINGNGNKLKGIKGKE